MIINYHINYKYDTATGRYLPWSWLSQRDPSLFMIAGSWLRISPQHSSATQPNRQWRVSWLSSIIQHPWSDIGSSKFIVHQITNCLSAFAGRRHDTREATTMTAEQLFNRKFLKKRQCNHMSIPGCLYWEQIRARMYEGWIKVKRG